MKEEKYDKLLDVFHIPIENYIPNKPQGIYHYTSPEGLQGIISKNTLRFTDRNYLNDYSEGRYVMEICIKSRVTSLLPQKYRTYFKQLCKEMLVNPLKKKVPIFQCSFSVESDSLPLWNYYSKSEGIKGYNVCFNSDELINGIKTYSYKTDDKSVGRLKVFGSRVIYNEKKQKDIIRNIIIEFTNIINENIADVTFCKNVVQSLVDKLLFIGSFFKPSHFNCEEEYRVLIKPILTIKNGANEYCVIEKEPDSTVKNGLIIPHIDLEFNKLNLIGIGVSPTLNFDEVKFNLTSILKTYSYDFKNIKIVKSDIPVRF